MSEYQPHSSYETDRLPYTKTAGRRAVRIAIGQGAERALQTSSRAAAYHASAPDAVEWPA